MNAKWYHHAIIIRIWLEHVVGVGMEAISIKCYKMLFLLLLQNYINYAIQIISYFSLLI